MVNGRRIWARTATLGAVGGGLIFSAVQAAVPDFIGVFAEEGGDSYQAVAEITLESGEVVSVVYSQGRSDYLPQQNSTASVPENESGNALITLSNPQMSEYFIPGLLGYTAAGGPEVDQDQKVAEASRTQGSYSENRKADLDMAISNSFTLRQTSGLQVSLDFLPIHAREYHTNSFSR